MGTKREQDSGREDSLGRRIKVSGRGRATSTSAGGGLDEVTSDFSSEDVETEPETTTISDLFDPADLDAEISGRFVSMRTHPEDPDLAIIAYTAAAQYERRWNDVTRAARGLIFRRDDGEVLARPWSKFFNHSEDLAAPVSLYEPCQVTDKMDGSLGVGYRMDDGRLRLSTKGSFTSEMVPVATELISRYDTDTLPEGYTPLFEIIYPENRIVLDYGGTRDVYLLGAVHTASGRVLGPDAPELADYDGPRTEVMNESTLADALARAPRPNAEGLIVRSTGTGNMVKIKQEDYVRLHRVMTGMSTKVIWENLRAGDFDKLLEQVPDEMYDEVHRHHDQMVAQYHAIDAQITADGERIHAHALAAGEPGSAAYKKAFALEARAQGVDKLVVARFLGGQDLSDKLWDRVKPEMVKLGSFAPRTSEDSA